MLKTLHLQNFTVFPNARLEFSPGLNVLIGENGAGKSHLLKLGYSLLNSLGSPGNRRPAKTVAERAIAQELVGVFGAESLGRLVSRTQGDTRAGIEVTWSEDGAISLYFSGRSSERVHIDRANYPPLPSSVLFLPPGEILSVFAGFQGAIEKRELAFDATYLSLTMALNNAPLQGKLLQETFGIIREIEAILGAKIVKRENRFFFVSKSRGEIEAHLASIGERKLGMLAYLLMNGEIRKDTVLFMDTPEAGLNPLLQKRLAKILVLASSCMQIVIATHSLFFLKELMILQMQKELKLAMYFGIHKSGNGSAVLQGESIEEIGDIALLDAAIAQSDRYMQLAYEEGQNTE